MRAVWRLAVKLPDVHEKTSSYSLCWNSYIRRLWSPWYGVVYLFIVTSILKNWYLMFNIYYKGLETFCSNKIICLRKKLWVLYRPEGVCLERCLWSDWCIQYIPILHFILHFTGLSNIPTLDKGSHMTLAKSKASLVQAFTVSVLPW